MVSQAIKLRSTSLKDVLHESCELLADNNCVFGQGMQSALDEAAYLVSFVMRLPPDFCPDRDNRLLTELEIEHIQDILVQRISGHQPLAYVLGKTWLAGIEFNVNQHVLIPRSPIAQMILEQCFPWVQSDQVTHVLDLCTGSGCLGILAALAFPEARVDITDIDSQALEVAQANVAKHGLESRINVICSDVYAHIPKLQYDIIIANPPYVPLCEQSQLPSEFKQEPQHALFSGEDGLDIVKRIIADAHEYLASEGVLILEVGQYADVLEAHYPDQLIMWHDFEDGGEGVCVLSAQDCQHMTASSSS
jgi:ribosomal protein L3 glutamine methyltransferase